ncbi:guanylate kinase [Desulforudis sp. 1088]|jgi:guanylate kinase|uniref:guanylate kinase n=1 Tax=unclassified Candidatus Desulforudis TaxID=2635950 RepID=UPI003BEC1179
MQGLLVVISGPSGAGKGTICKELRRLSPDARVSISATTRPPRAGEVEGKDYYFKSEEEFQDMLTRGEMLEWARVYSYCYGTPRAPVAALMADGHDVILEIDVQGGLQVKQQLPDAVLVFIAPPSFTELERRLKGRGTETPEAVAERMRWARSEMKQVKQYDYVVVNDDLTEAVSKVLSIIIAEKCRVKYYRFVEPF